MKIDMNWDVDKELYWDMIRFITYKNQEEEFVDWKKKVK